VEGGGKGGGGGGGRKHGGGGGTGGAQNPYSGQGLTNYWDIGPCSPGEFLKWLVSLLRSQVSNERVIKIYGL